MDMIFRNRHSAMNIIESDQCHVSFFERFFSKK